MPPRARWFDYQLTFRTQPLATLQLEWRGKTNRQKAEWRKAYNAVLESERLVQNHEAGHAGILQRQVMHDGNVAAGVIIVRDHIDYNNFIDAVNVLANDHAQSERLWGNVAHDYDALSTVETNQNDHADSINHAIAQRNLARTEVRRAQREQIRMENAGQNPPVVLDHNNKRRMPASWVEDVDLRRFRVDIDNDIAADHTGDLLQQGQWRAQHILLGGLSRGYIYVLVDNNNHIIDKLVRKDTFLGFFDWIDPLKWGDDLRNMSHRLPYELSITRDMSQIPNLPYSLRPRVTPTNRHVSNNHLSYTLYTELAPHGDLNALINRHRGNAPISESFCWYILYALATAAVGMEHGLVGVPGAPIPPSPAPNWLEIVHRDLKPGNIFLDTKRDAPTYPHYPTPVLADYGLAVRTSVNDSLNPHFLTKCGTPGYRAPEQIPYINRNNLDVLDNERLNASTNVYGIGLILRALLTRNHPPEPLWIGDPRPNAPLLPIPNPTGYYSQDLIGAVEGCLRWEPGARLTLEQLLTLHQIAVLTGLCRGMDDGTAGAGVVAVEMPMLGNVWYPYGMVRPAPVL